MPIRASTAANRSALSASEFAIPEYRGVGVTGAATLAAALAALSAASFSCLCNII
jgi:hypothetical protein